MASLPTRFVDTGKSFVNLDLCPDQPKVLVVLLGGSSLYREERERADCADWDGAILVRSKLDILTLVNKKRPSLMAMLDIEREEHPELQIPEPSSLFWCEFDAVRFSGYTSLHSKRSVKILSLEYFLGSKTSLNILSYKDKRIYEAVKPGTAAPIRTYRIQQATRLPNGLIILHDQWVYSAPTGVCSHGRASVSAAFGVTADLLVSGACLRGNDSSGRLMKETILAHYSAATGHLVTVNSFARCTFFSSTYAEWLTRELSEVYSRIQFNPPWLRCSCTFGEGRFLFGRINAMQQAVTNDFSDEVNRLPLEFCQHFEQQDGFPRSSRDPSVFASNSTAYETTILDKNGATTKAFCKRSQHQEDEVQGALLAAAFYPQIQLPHVASSGELLYPFFEGTTESELRLSYIQGGRSDWNTAELLLYTEMVKSEDTLRAYRMSLTTRGNGKTSDPTIQRFFHSRLVKNRRFREFYEDGVQWLGKTIAAADFLKMRWRINGIEFSCLSEIFGRALDVLHPGSDQIASCPVAFGLGDAHGGNVMVSPHLRPDNSHQIMYVDYEVAGLHAVMLDLAKPLYNDVFFETLYMDLLPDVAASTCELDGECFCVNFPPGVDEITQAIFDIKRRYLIQPLCDAAQTVGCDLSGNVPLLSNALLLCAVLTRNYSKAPEVLLHNAAIGILLSGANDWEDLYERFRKLGFSSQL